MFAVCYTEHILTNIGRVIIYN